MFLFLFYRIIEKLLKIRPESLIGFLMFYFFSKYFKIFKKIELKKYEDKRTLWGLFRFNDKSKWNLENFSESINRSVNYGKICFENSMETSIRGINLINIISKDKLTYQKNKSFFDMYLRICKSHTILCPDLYIKRFGFRFTDESNNHRFYNLIFLQFYNFFFKKKINFDEVEKFVKKRMVDKLFFDEGSSFYHFGVIDALLKTRNFFNTNSNCSFSVSFDKLLDEISIHQNVLEKLNFGDRDGTIIFNNSFKSSAAKNSQIFEINISKLYLKHNKSQYVFLRKQNWTDFGTEGHVHDDFGMFCISNGCDSILDVGISTYSVEPFFCKNTYHNFPYTQSNPEMLFKSKFVRVPNKSNYINKNKNFISLISKHNNMELCRKMDLINDIFIDSIEINKNFKDEIYWKFCLNKKSKIYINHLPDTINSTKTTVLIDNLCYFESNYKMNVYIETGNYFPDYGTEEECVFLNFNLNCDFLDSNENSHFELLKCERKFDFNN